MKRMLISSINQNILCMALIKDNKLYDLDIENCKYTYKKSNIYKGKIIHVEPSLNAAFVDYGAEKHGFLPFKEIGNEYFTHYMNNNKKYNIQDIMQKGQEVIVQIDKVERYNKGATLTTCISLAGAYIVLMPNNPKSYGISRKIEGNSRNEIKETLSTLNLPEGMGVIIRTAGLGQTSNTLQLDLSLRIKHWLSIKQVAASNSAPCLIYQENNIMLRAFRDYLQPDIEEIIIDDITLFNQAKKYISYLGRIDFKNKIKLYEKNIPLFNFYKIESQINSVFQRTIKLPSGGSIVIDTTEALTAIDINSSRSTKGNNIEETAFYTNLEATYEVAKQLRLRDIGGLVVIDFIDMTPIQNIRKIEHILKSEIQQDRARIQLGRISKFGLLELSRQRLHHTLYEYKNHVCLHCNGTGLTHNNKSLSLSFFHFIEESSIKNNNFSESLCCINTYKL